MSIEYGTNNRHKVYVTQVFGTQNIVYVYACFRNLPFFLYIRKIHATDIIE